MLHTIACMLFDRKWWRLLPSDPRLEGRAILMARVSRCDLCERLWFVEEPTPMNSMDEEGEEAAPELPMTEDQEVEIELACGPQAGEDWRQRLEQRLGATIRRITPTEAEATDMVVCALREDLPKLFTDDLYGNCAQCGTDIRWRPTSPKAPPKVCLNCATKTMALYNLAIRIAKHGIKYEPDKEHP